MKIVPRNANRFSSAKRRHDRRQRRRYRKYKQPSMAIRLLVAPKLAKKYQMVVILEQRLSVADAEDIVETLSRILGANRFRPVYSNRRGELIKLRLVREDDLAMIRLCFSTSIYKILRIVAE